MLKTNPPALPLCGIAYGNFSFLDALMRGMARPKMKNPWFRCCETGIGLEVSGGTLLILPDLHEFYRILFHVIRTILDVSYHPCKSGKISAILSDPLADPRPDSLKFPSLFLNSQEIESKGANPGRLVRNFMAWSDR